MTPKEKAEELILKYRLIEFDKTEDTRLLISLKDAKDCALIAVDEIINSYPHTFDLETEYTKDKTSVIVMKNIKSNIPYWQEVKQEIEKL